MRYTNNENVLKHDIFDITIKGEVDVRNIKIKHIEGGFGEGFKIILARDIARIHGMELREINQLINNNIDEFEEGIDIIDIKKHIICNDMFLENGVFTKAQWGNAKNIYILSEQGYMALVSLMRTDKAREIRKQLRREYFAMRSVIKKQNESYLIEDPIERAKAWIKEEEERRRLANIVEEQAPKIEYHDAVLNSDKLVSVTDIANDLGVSARRLNSILKDNGVQWKKSKNWLIKSEYYWLMEEGYCDFVINEFGQILKWTEKGRQWIIDNFSDEL